MFTYKSYVAIFVPLYHELLPDALIEPAVWGKIIKEMEEREDGDSNLYKALSKL